VRRRTANTLVAVGTAAVLTLWLALVVSPGSRVTASEGSDFQLRRGSVKALGVGKLLVASRNLPDPNFSATVILLLDFNQQGAMGLIVNRPTTVPLSRMLPGLEQTSGGGAPAFVGGPVSPSGVLALLRSKSPRSDIRHVAREVYLVNKRDALMETVAAGVGPDRFRVYVGYTGWGAGQLEDETAEGAWHVLDGDDDVVFDPDPASTWRRQIRRTEELSAGGTQGPAPLFDHTAAGHIDPSARLARGLWRPSG
jgi:putative transcriptional regulator